MSKNIIQCEISMGKDHTTLVGGYTIEEVIEKIRDYHTLGDFERAVFTEKGTLDEEIASGWYFKETV